jgi:hypothetical protein
MFQFPGFALKPLCIQGKSTWLCSLMSAPRSPSKRTPRSNNQKPSGGFPHSDIHGSKPVPGSPWLNAGYHVLHRLLLPRHPPNALFALDLIQKEQGWFNLPLPALTSLGGRSAQSVCKSKLTCQKHVYLPIAATRRSRRLVY